MKPLLVLCPPSPFPHQNSQGSLSASLVLSSLTGREVLTPFPGLGTAAAPAQGGAHLKQCDLLKLSRRQKQLCRREPGLAETLQDAAHLSLLECQFQFRHERWNCSLEGRTGLLKRGREEGGGRAGGEASLPAPLAPGPRLCCPCQPSIVPGGRVPGVNEAQAFPRTCTHIHTHTHTYARVNTCKTGGKNMEGWKAGNSWPNNLRWARFMRSLIHL